MPSHRPFDEVRRLGLQESTETYVRKLDPTEIGMLVAETVVPKGPASLMLEEGDVLISINGQYITKFVPLEEVLDNRLMDPSEDLQSVRLTLHCVVSGKQLK